MCTALSKIKTLPVQMVLHFQSHPKLVFTVGKTWYLYSLALDWFYQIKINSNRLFFLFVSAFKRFESIYGWSWQNKVVKWRAMTSINDFSVVDCPNKYPSRNDNFLLITVDPERKEAGMPIGGKRRTTALWNIIAFLVPQESEDMRLKITR